MKAIGVKEFGNIHQLTELDIPKPIPTKGRLIIKNLAFALNPYDIGIIDGSQAKYRPIKLPAVPGSDVAGIIVDKDPDIADFAIGDLVVGRANLSGYAEYVSVPHLRAAKIPAGVDVSMAAALPNASITAYDIIFGALKNVEYHSVLIVGLSGAVGSTAAQILIKEGKHVAGILNSVNKQFAFKLPIDEYAFYDQPTSLSELSTYDVVINTAPIDKLQFSLEPFLNPSGTILSTTEISDIESNNIIAFNDTDYKLNKIALNYLVQMLSKKELKVPLNPLLTFNVASIQEALSNIRDHHPIGKFVVKI